MNLYKISQTVNNDYDTYDSAVVAAPSAEAAKRICPDGFYELRDDDNYYFIYSDGTSKNKGKIPKYFTWCAVKDVNVELIGVAKEGTPQGVIISSFNAG